MTETEAYEAMPSTCRACDCDPEWGDRGPSPLLYAQMDAPPASGIAWCERCGTLWQRVGPRQVASCRSWAWERWALGTRPRPRATAADLALLWLLLGTSLALTSLAGWVGVLAARNLWRLAGGRAVTSRHLKLVVGSCALALGFALTTVALSSGRNHEARLVGAVAGAALAALGAAALPEGERR